MVVVKYPSIEKHGPHLQQHDAHDGAEDLANRVSDERLPLEGLVVDEEGQRHDRVQVAVALGGGGVERKTILHDSPSYLMPPMATIKPIKAMPCTMAFSVIS